MLRVGLTGGIASGKTVVTTRLRERGVTVIDADALAHEVVGPGTLGLAEVVAEFGESVLQGDGRLDRARLAALVFGNDAARAKLEGIVHPLVAEGERRLEEEARTRGERIVVHDIPLLIETGQQDFFDVLLVVDAPAELRARRLVESRGFTQAQAWERIDAQATDEQRREAADVVFDGSGSVEFLRQQVDDWLDHAV